VVRAYAAGVAAPVEPPELARVLDFAERPRTDDWSLRSGLVRYAQPDPVRVNLILELVRRVEWALKPRMKTIEREGTELWAALSEDTSQSDDDNAALVELLRTTVQLDRLGDLVAAWAVDPRAERPDAEVDALTSDVAQRLDALGVPREERTRPPRSRG